MGLVGHVNKIYNWTYLYCLILYVDFYIYIWTNHVYLLIFVQVKGMVSFIKGREKEKIILGQCLEDGSSHFVAVYGRRRVGKTFLIREFFEDELIFDFTGSFNVDMHTQLANFSFALKMADQQNEYDTLPESWFEAFRRLIIYISAIKNKSKKVIFLDELPWMSTPRSNFLSALEYLWNDQLSKRKDIILIVCGSAASWIQNKILNDTGGLYNRVTVRIRLLPFTLYETEQYLVSRNIMLTRFQIIQLYMCMGGIPHYLKEIQRGRSAIQEINRICFQEGGLLTDEFNLIYDSLYGNNSNHKEIVMLLAKKPNGLTRNDIINGTSLSSGGSINRSLEDLESSGFITSIAPFGKRSKETIYRITDLYSHFYIKFLAERSSRANINFELISNTSSWRSWAGYAFENICLLHIDNIKRALGISGIVSENISWKHKGDSNVQGAQIDLLIDRADNVINLCEVKFSESVYTITKSYASLLRQKRNIFNQVTQTRKACFTVMVTTFGCAINDHYLGEVQSQVTADDLFQL